MNDRPRALVCDDESQSLRALRVTLRYAGFDVCTTQSVEEALDRAAVSVPDAAIIELVLPDGDGVELCRQLREWSTAAIMMLSTVGDSEQAVRALNAGADDYLTKPFRPDELVARLRAILRRANRGSDEPRLKLHGLEIDFAARVVCREGRPVHLTPIEFKLLRALATNPGRLLTHTELLRHGWGTAYAPDRHTLRAHIANLRRKVGPAGALPLIRTDHGVGYRFTDSDAVPQSQSLGLLVTEGPSNPRPGESASLPSRRLMDTAFRSAA
jgi:two-component system KDP operon response regulator KdpE